MPLKETLTRLKAARHTDWVWAKRKYDSYYRRYSSDETVGRRFGELCVQTGRRLCSDDRGLVQPADAATAAADLIEGVLTGRCGPAEVREQTGLDMETMLFLHRLTGGHREAYYALVEDLPTVNEYAPTYITMGPTGKCNVVCPDCIIGGAIFKKERQALKNADDVMPYLAQAEAQGVGSVSFCIGEPTYNVPALYKAFDFIRDSDVLTARSMVTNALFARKYDKAVRFFEGFREHLGDDKARQCMVGVSLNDDLKKVGVPVQATANLIQAFSEVLPDHRLVMQLIMDAGFHNIQNELFTELGERGLVAEPDALQLAEEGYHEALELTNGTRVLVSVMRKQPSLHNPWARAESDFDASDPWVRFFTDEALTKVPLKGLYTYEGGDDPDEGEGGIVVHRITLGPDGVLYPDYHFMVAGARPLGTTMDSAVESFRSDPILGLLLKRGGLNALLETYMSIPEDERLLDDIYAAARSCSTTGMVGANVLFGDYEVAGQLATRLMTHGIASSS